MPNTMEQIQDQIIADFSRFKLWEQKYKHLIQKGKDLDPLSDNEKTDDLKVKGCQSQVWLKAKLLDTGRVSFKADSDALIVKGLVALLLQIYSDQYPKDILNTPLYFVAKTELGHHLSASRTNGLNSMIQQIKYYAQALSLLAQTRK